METVNGNRQETAARTETDIRAKSSAQEEEDRQIREAMSCCVLCPRECRADRNAGARGYCGMDAQVRVARAALHMWEEPPIAPPGKGSGAVFFSGCSLKCLFCQNRDIASGKAGIVISWQRLAEIFLELQEKGAANINLVTAGHYIPQTAAALRLAGREGLRIPVVYNTGGYEKAESLKRLEGLIDIYLPDLKYGKEDTAREYSRAGHYMEWAKEALAEMVRQVPEAVFTEDGVMKKGVMVRHLLLPGHVKEAEAVLEYLYRSYGNRIWYSLMNQYTPMPDVAEDPLLGRRTTKREYEKLLSFALSLGIETAFYQEGGTAKESFIPAFDGEGVLPAGYGT